MDLQKLFYTNEANDQLLNTDQLLMRPFTVQIN